MLEFKIKTKCFKVRVKTQQWCINISILLWQHVPILLDYLQASINISILLWQHVPILLDYLQASIQRYEVQSVHIMYCGIPYCLQGVHKNSIKL